MLSLKNKMNCCKKAFLMGLLYNADIERSPVGRVVFSQEDAAQSASEILGTVASPKITELVRAGRRLYALTFSSKAVSSFLYKVSCGEAVASACGFRCDACQSSFLRGVIVSCSTVSDPYKKSYYFEISLPNEKPVLIDKLRELIEDCSFSPKQRTRDKKTALYFKSNTQISDIFSYVGAVNSSFAIANAYIEMDIRNHENRATNCVATNISKTVEAAKKQRAAIRKLIDGHKLDSIPKELRETARLRIENEEASLSELALLHDPPISKSGLNHRLAKLCELAEESD